MSYRVDRFAQEDTSDLQSLSGVPGGSTDLGTFTGNTIPDNQTTKHALQALETEVEDRLPDFVQWRVGTGPGYYFDGTNDYIDSTLSLAGWSDFSTYFQFTPDDVASSVVLASDYGGASDYGWTVGIQNGKIYLELADGTTTNFTKYFSEFLPSAGTRYSLVTIKDGSEISIYVNGKKQPISPSTTGSGYSGDIHSGSNSVRFGRFGTSAAYYEGVIHTAKIFNRALTPAEVALVSNGQNLGFADFGASGAPSYESDFSGDTNSWTVGAGDGTIEVGVPVGGDSNVLKFNISSGAGTKSMSRVVVGSALIGKRVRASFEYYIPSGNSLVNSVNAYFSTDPIYAPGSETAVDTWTAVVGEAIIAYNSITIYGSQGASISIGDPGSSDYIAIRNVVITPIGEVLRHTGNGAAPGVWANEANNNIGNSTVTGATLINRRALSVDKFASFTNLPTSSAGLAVGRMWLDGNTPKIVT